MGTTHFFLKPVHITVSEGSVQAVQALQLAHGVRSVQYVLH